MRVGLLGDVHGNYLALEAVLRSALSERVEKLLITGDLVGYYLWPDRVLEMLEPWNVSIVQGNHELMLAEICDHPERLDDVAPLYKRGLIAAMETLSKATLKRLALLPDLLKLSIDNSSILLCHGSPWDLNQYIYPDSDSELFIKAASHDCEWVVLGHTHYPMIRTIGGVRIINPGSVGQPRNGQSGASWAIIDTVNRKVSFRNEPYNNSEISMKISKLCPDVPELADALMRT